jgi:hypothetical protein
MAVRSMEDNVTLRGSSERKGFATTQALLVFKEQ